MPLFTFHHRIPTTTLHSPPKHQFPVSYVVTPSSFPPLPSIKSTYPGLLPLKAPTASCANPYANPIASPVFAVRAAVAIGKRSVWCLVSTTSGPMINKCPQAVPAQILTPNQHNSHHPGKSQALALASRRTSPLRHLPVVLSLPRTHVSFFTPHTHLTHLRIASLFPSRVSSLRIPLSGTPASHLPLLEVPTSRFTVRRNLRRTFQIERGVQPSILPFQMRRWLHRSFPE